jgi:hypothetical protein
MENTGLLFMVTLRSKVSHALDWLEVGLKPLPQIEACTWNTHVRIYCLLSCLSQWNNLRK